MFDVIKQTFRKKDGDWDFGEWHYFLAGLWIGFMLGKIMEAGIMLILIKILEG